MAKGTKRIISYSEIEDKYASYYLLDDKVIIRLEKALKKLKENKSKRTLNRKNPSYSRFSKLKG